MSSAETGKGREPETASIVLVEKASSSTLPCGVGVVIATAAAAAATRRTIEQSKQQETGYSLEGHNVGGKRL